MKFPIYMDNHATTPVDPRVLDAMLPFLKDKFGNVGSEHLCGRETRSPVAIARKQVAALINAGPDEIVFTSGATESDNLAIKGVAFSLKKKGDHVITCKTEHKAVLDTCKFLEAKGFTVTYLDVDRYGRVSAADVRKAMDKRPGKTVLVSLMGANNEIGTIHPLQEIGTLCKDNEIVFHVDAAQCAGKIPFDVRACHADMASISAHKMYGPKGIGALFVRKSLRDKLEPQMHGGGQEWGIRSGTIAVPMAVALGTACEIAMEELSRETKRLSSMRARLEKTIVKEVGGVKVNGHPDERLPGNLSLTFENVDGEMMMLALKEICCSATSACSSALPAPSHVLRALGLTDNEAMATIRFGIGRFNTDEEVDYVAQRVKDVVTALRQGLTPKPASGPVLSCET
ncbi:MAG: cysteine desulfurase family protein [Oligoflexales bacterium]